MSGTQAQVAEDGGDAAPPPDADQALETRARNMGWRPREDWRGDPARWTDAAEFVDRGERLLPLVNERNRALDKTVTDLRGQVAKQNETLEFLVKTARNAETIGYKRAMRELQERREAAVDAGDKTAFARVEEEIKELGPAPVVEAPKPDGGGNGAAAPDPVVVAWAKRNPWFHSDPMANAAAIVALDQVQKRDPSLSLEEALVEVEQTIQGDFPRLFRRVEPGSDDPPPAPAPRRSTAPMVASPSTAARSGTPKPRSFDAMPADVKAQYDRSVRMLEGKGEKLTKEEFAGYYWDQYPEDV